jgi:hypothetical protein
MVCIGLRGNPLKSIPSIVSSALADFKDDKHTHLSLALRDMRCVHQKDWSKLTKGAELADSFKYPYPLQYYEYVQIGEKPEAFRQFIKLNTCLNWSQYRYLFNHSFATNYPQLVTENPALAYTLIDRFSILSRSKEFVDYISNKLVKYRLNLRQYYDIINFLYSAWELCRRNNIEIDKNNNIIRQFLETANSEQLAKTNQAQEWENIYKPIQDKISFETDDYITVVPKNPLELVREGVFMHNCVGGYIDRVLNKSCVVVFIRQKNNPNSSYITCELRETEKGWEIRQFLLSCNHRITKDKDIEFHQAYQKHLSNIKIK